jgi:hydroxymethylpyrimidine/phosphomethylpyrimidine kinase
MPPKGRVLIVAGSDSGGGAGIQGDIKTVSALGGYAMTAITALTAQNTLGVHGVHSVPAAFVAQQMRVVLDDIGADAIKTGMLHTAEVVAAVADVLEEYPQIPLILDPVMIAKGGAALLQPEAVELLIRRLLPRALLITPNLPEAEALVKNDDPMIGYEPIKSVADMISTGKKILSYGSYAVLLKGGHLSEETLTDIFIQRPHLSSDHRIIEFPSPRIDTRHTHGTGCALASAIAAGIAQGMALPDAVGRAHRYVQYAIANAPGLGGGHGPLGHNLAN